MSQPQANEAAKEAPMPLAKAIPAEEPAAELNGTGNAVKDPKTGQLVPKSGMNTSDRAMVSMIGHNSKATGTTLIAGVENIEKLEEARKQINDQIKDQYASLRENGFPTKPLRQIVNLRKQEKDVQKNYVQDLVMLDELVNQGDLFGGLMSSATRQSLRAMDPTGEATAVAAEKQTAEAQAAAEPEGKVTLAEAAKDAVAKDTAAKKSKPKPKAKKK